MMVDNADDIQASLCSAEDELKQQIRVARLGPGAATSTPQLPLPTFTLTTASHSEAEESGT